MFTPVCCTVYPMQKHAIHPFQNMISNFYDLCCSKQENAGPLFAREWVVEQFIQSCSQQLHLLMEYTVFPYKALKCFEHHNKPNGKVLNCT